MSRRLFLQSFTALLGGFALPALTQAKSPAKQWKTLQISPGGIPISSRRNPLAATRYRPIGHPDSRTR